LAAKAHDLVYFRPAELNEYGNCGPTLFYQAHVNFAPPPHDRLTPWLDEKGPLPALLPLGAAFEEMRRIFETLCLEIARPGAAHRLRVRAAVFEILALAADVLARKPAGAARLDPWQRARLRLESELAADLKISRLAREAGLGVDHFIRGFKKRFGVTPKACRLNAKLREAARLLRGTDRPVKAVAYELGFGDAKAFARLFRSRLGVAPSDLQSAGALRPTKELPAGKALYPVNQHLIPPEAGADWFERWRCRDRGKA
jgi:AraC-like DNA-binding protein